MEKFNPEITKYTSPPELMKEFILKLNELITQVNQLQASLTTEIKAVVKTDNE